MFCGRRKGRSLVASSTCCFLLFLPAFWLLLLSCLVPASALHHNHAGAAELLGLGTCRWRMPLGHYRVGRAVLSVAAAVSRAFLSLTEARCGVVCPYLSRSFVAILGRLFITHVMPPACVGGILEA